MIEDRNLSLTRTSSYKAHGPFGSFTSYFVFVFVFFNFYLFMIVTQEERERGRDTGRGRSRLHAPEARRGSRSLVSRIAPWAKGRRQTAAPPRDPTYVVLLRSSWYHSPSLPTSALPLLTHSCDHMVAE